MTKSERIHLQLAHNAVVALRIPLAEALAMSTEHLILLLKLAPQPKQPQQGSALQRMVADRR